MHISLANLQMKKIQGHDMSKRQMNAKKNKKIKDKAKQKITKIAIEIFSTW